MSRMLRAIILYAVAGAFSAAAAAPLVGMFAITLVGGPLGVIGLIGGVGGIGVSLKFAALPAMLIGGALWTGGATHKWAGSRYLWAAVGVLMGLAGYALARTTGIAEFELLDSAVQSRPSIIAAAFALAGAVSALLFRATMDVLLLFVPAEDS